MRFVVLAEHHITQISFLAENRQGVQLVVPDDIVRFLERCPLFCPDQLGERGHEFGHLGRGIHTGHAVVAACNDTDKLARASTVLGHRNRGMSGFRLQRNDVRKRGVGLDVGVADNKTRLVILGASDHRRLILHRLRAVNEGHAALFGKRYRQPVPRHRLHDRRHQRNIHGNRRFLATTVSHKRRAQRDVRRNALGGRIPRDQQIFAEGV